MLGFSPLAGAPLADVGAPYVPVVGASMTLSAGTFSKTEAPGFTGAALVISAGQFPEVPLGASVTLSTGTFVPNVIFGVVGASMTARAGQFGETPLGASVTVSVGTFTGVDTLGLTGASVTLTAGQFPEVLLGVGLILRVGQFPEIPLGTGMTLFAGTMTEPVQPTITGVSMTLSAAILADIIDSNVLVPGVHVTLSAATIPPQDIIGLFGVQMQVNVGLPTFINLPMTHINSISQQPTVDDEIELYIIDATAIGGDIYHITSNAFTHDEVGFQGDTYAPHPVSSEGWEWNGRGSLPTPTLRVSNVSLAFGAAVIAYDDLKGATVTRIRTYKRYLDGQPYADSVGNAYPLDIYNIDRKRLQNNTVIEWELAAVTDQQGIYLPRRPVLRNACTHRYRRWNSDTSSFDYVNATCPFAGASYFDANGRVTDAAHDRCGKKLSDCKLRFADAPLPTRAFPGVARTAGLN